MHQPVHVILTTTTEGGIAMGGTIPWTVEDDMEHHKKMTLFVMDPKKHNAVIMGRKTWESLPAHYKPLPGRDNAVITTSMEDYGPNVVKFTKLEDAVAHFQANDQIENIWVMGGVQLYHEALLHPDLSKILLTTVISPPYQCDTCVDMMRFLNNPNLEKTNQSPIFKHKDNSFHLGMFQRIPNRLVQVVTQTSS